MRCIYDATINNIFQDNIIKDPTNVNKRIGYYNDLNDSNSNIHNYLYFESYVYKVKSYRCIC